jgi:hypothetical protein
MKNIDVFNGDADGLCALHQLRLTRPADSTLVTGVKRDIKLLERVQADPRDMVTVLDISIGENKDALLRLLNLGVQVTYFDHHFTGIIGKHNGLTAVLDSSPDTCTSALVDRYVGGEHRAWAIVAAFGDNLPDLAQRLGESLHLTSARFDVLRDMGQCLNYNAYGDSIADLYFDPADLYDLMKRHREPWRFAEKEATVFAKLREGRAADFALALGVEPARAGPSGAIYVMPDMAWSRRIRGDFANRLALAEPARAFAVLTGRAGGGYSASIRAPKAKPKGADELCLQFETGGGRAAAAGVNDLPMERLDEFCSRFFAQFS